MTQSQSAKGTTTIQLKNVFRVTLAVPAHVTFSYLSLMITTYKGVIARQEPRSDGYSPYSCLLAVDFDQPADRADFTVNITGDVSGLRVFSESQTLNVPTTCRV